MAERDMLERLEMDLDYWQTLTDEMPICPTDCADVQLTVGDMRDLFAEITHLRAEVEDWIERHTTVVESNNCAHTIIEGLENHIISLEQDARLPEDEYAYQLGFERGWMAAHENAPCGHARANWKDPKYGTREYEGEERCEFCDATRNGGERTGEPGGSDSSKEPLV